MAHMVDVLAVDFKVEDRLAAGAGFEGGDGDRAAGRAEALADVEFAGGDEGPAVRRVDRVVGGDPQRSHGLSVVRFQDLHNCPIWTASGARSGQLVRSTSSSRRRQVLSKFD